MSNMYVLLSVLLQPPLFPSIFPSTQYIGGHLGETCQCLKTIPDSLGIPTQGHVDGRRGSSLRSDGTQRSHGSLKPAQTVVLLEPDVETFATAADDDSKPFSVKSQTVYTVKPNSHGQIKGADEHAYKLTAEDNVDNTDSQLVSTENVKGHSLSKRFSEFVGKREGLEDVSTDTKTDYENVNHEATPDLLPVFLSDLARGQDENQQELSDKRAYDFVGKRSYDFVGKKSYDFVGKKRYDFLGKRYPYDFVGKRSPYDFVGKRSPYDFVGKRSPYDFVGKRSPYDFVGKRSPYDFVGKRSPYDFVGKRSPYDFVGKRSPYDFVGKRSPYDFVGKRSPYDFVGKRSSYEFVGKRSPYDFVGKRPSNELNSKADQAKDSLENQHTLRSLPTTSEYIKAILINQKPHLTSENNSEAGEADKRYTEFLGKKKRAEEQTETILSDSHRLEELLEDNGFRKRLSELLTQKFADQFPEFIGKRS